MNMPMNVGLPKMQAVYLLVELLLVLGAGVEVAVVDWIWRVSWDLRFVKGHFYVFPLGSGGRHVDGMRMISVDSTHSCGVCLHSHT